MGKIFSLSTILLSLLVSRLRIVPKTALNNPGLLLLLGSSGWERKQAFLKISEKIISRNDRLLWITNRSSLHLSRLFKFSKFLQKNQGHIEIFQIPVSQWSVGEFLQRFFELVGRYSVIFFDEILVEDFITRKLERLDHVRIGGLIIGTLSQLALQSNLRILFSTHLSRSNQVWGSMHLEAAKRFATGMIYADPSEDSEYPRRH